MIRDGGRSGYHMQDDLNSLDHNIDQLVGQIGVEFSAKSCPSNTREQGLFNFLMADFELV